MTKHQGFVFILDQSGKTQTKAYNYDSKKMLHTYMNKIVIDESDENEVLSYQEFLKVPSTVPSTLRHEKHLHDQNIIRQTLGSIKSDRISHLHIVISGDYYDYSYGITTLREELDSVISKCLENQTIRHATVNILSLQRLYLITKETMEEVCNNVLTTDRFGLKVTKESINDDVEKLVDDLRNHDLRTRSKLLYFLPKLSNKERKEWPMESCERQNALQVFEYKAFSRLQKDPDVPTREMILSDSNAKYCYSVGARKTDIYEDYKVVIREDPSNRVTESDMMVDPTSEPLILPGEDFEEEDFSIDIPIEENPVALKLLERFEN